jgi:hypothetical protein
MLRKPESLLQTAKRHFLSDRLVLILNGLLLLLLAGLALYVRLFNQGDALEALFSISYNNFRPYFGALTTTGNLFLCSAIAIYGFSCTLLHQVERRIDRFTLSLAGVLGMIMCDRIFRLSTALDGVAGLPVKKLMYLFYATASIIYAWTFRRELVKTPYLLMVMAIALLVFGGVIDLLHLSGHGKPAMLEEGSTLLAMLNIAIYAGLVCKERVLKRMQ